MGGEGLLTFSLALGSEVGLEFAALFEGLLAFAAFEVAFEGVWEEGSATFFTRNEGLFIVISKCKFIIGFFVQFPRLDRSFKIHRRHWNGSPFMFWLQFLSFDPFVFTLRNMYR